MSGVNVRRFEYPTSSLRGFAELPPLPLTVIIRMATRVHSSGKCKQLFGLTVKAVAFPLRIIFFIWYTILSCLI